MLLRISLRFRSLWRQSGTSSIDARTCSRAEAASSPARASRSIDTLSRYSSAAFGIGRGAGAYGGGDVGFHSRLARLSLLQRREDRGRPAAAGDDRDAVADLAFEPFHPLSGRSARDMMLGQPRDVRA